jgi:hypothetical protein
MVIAGVGISNAYKSASKGIGPVTQASVQQSLGDVPLYPGGTLDQKVTETTVITYRIMETTVLHKEAGSVFRGVAAQYTTDQPDKVLKFYEGKLKAKGWTQSHKQHTGFAEQHQYQKSGEMVIIQAQPAGDRTMVMVIRGGPDIAKGMKNQQGAPGSLPTPQAQ